MYFEKKLYKLLTEDEFKAISKDTGKVVVFKSKDAMKAALKKGSHTKVDKPKGDKKRSDADLFKKQNMDKDPDDIDDLSPDAVLGTDADPQEIESALAGTEEGLYDILDRDMGFGDNADADEMVTNDIQSAIDAGASNSDLIDFSNNLDGPARNIFQDALNSMGKELDIDADSDSDPGYESPGERDKKAGKGSENPYDYSDDNEDLYKSASEADLDQNIADGMDGIIPEKREKAFNLIIQGFDDEYDVKEMYDNLEADKIPKASEDPFGAIKHSILMQGIEDGTINFGDTGMKLASYIETREEDLYDQLMNPDQYDERIKVKESFQKRAGIVRG